MQTKLHLKYDDALPEGDEFVCRLVITLEKEEGGDDEEEHIGKGRSKKDAKHNSASTALKRSYILQSFMDGTMLFIWSSQNVQLQRCLQWKHWFQHIFTLLNLLGHISVYDLEVLSLQTRIEFKIVLKIVSLPKFKCGIIGNKHENLSSV